MLYDKPLRDIASGRTCYGDPLETTRLVGASQNFLGSRGHRLHQIDAQHAFQTRPLADDRLTSNASAPIAEFLHQASNCVCSPQGYLARLVILASPHCTLTLVEHPDGPRLYLSPNARAHGLRMYAAFYRRCPLRSSSSTSLPLAAVDLPGRISLHDARCTCGNGLRLLRSTRLSTAWRYRRSGPSFRGQKRDATRLITSLPRQF
ncbi:hypothetical protein DFH07DRAFT_964679 [Mycena maculata]|uniref:Uncharacterized protein n=1 Tax=Mycena maculata TaxID=230809 RepID=A0AAD7N2Z0_9AGAR|nr:hypothetical protein DFH07DRAFT_964679 [Mycena maculata]